jgi:hypothetical protein
VRPEYIYRASDNKCNIVHWPYHSLLLIRRDQLRDNVAHQLGAVTRLVPFVKVLLRRKYLHVFSLTHGLDKTLTCATIRAASSQPERTRDSSTRRVAALAGVITSCRTEVLRFNSGSIQQQHARRTTRLPMRENDSAMAAMVVVLPVPGGPCTPDTRKACAMAMAWRWDGFRMVPSEPEREACSTIHGFITTTLPLHSYMILTTARQEAMASSGSAVSTAMPASGELFSMRAASVETAARSTVLNVINKQR